MLLLYNFLQALLLILLFPLLVIIIALNPKYRTMLPGRLGIHLKAAVAGLCRSRRTIWIHALSVGEVTSALPLVAKLRREAPDVNIVFSASTRTGFTLAGRIMAPYSDIVISLPLDILPVCKYFIKTISPDLFILVETDFWPNLLHELHGKNIPAILVNGRISKKSMARYTRNAFFFKPMFQTFRYLCVQNDSDQKRFIDLGLSENRILRLGNLKYEALIAEDASLPSIDKGDDRPLIIAGSTHAGEEEILLDTFVELRKHHSPRLIIAPRDIRRTGDIVEMAHARNITVQLRSTTEVFSKDLLILDSIGELAAIYALGDICFVGGSMVTIGGHNPLEPAYHGKPVIFGQYMDDFEEISQDIIAGGGGASVTGQNDLLKTLTTLLNDPEYRCRCGLSARQSVLKMEGVLNKHFALIKELL
jgi:3-deoxy-D-manno-octulosonic-acid transferase